MAAVSGGDQTLLREKKDTQYSVERLYGFGYPPMWKGRLNDGGVARGDQTIIADTGAMESGYVFANLGADLLLFVGTAEGLSDKGRRRILSVSGSAAAPTFIVDWNDDVDWGDDDYLTAVNFYAPMPRHQWFTSSPIDFRVDGPPAALGGAGINYSDQNEDAVPQVIMGSNYAGELVSGTLAVQLSAANSQAVADGATISSYAWAAVPTAGASFNNAAIAAPILTFTADNSKYQVSCTVTDSNGKASVGHRCYIIGGAITEFSRGPITENYDRESVSCSITLTSPETTDSTAIRPVMTWADFADKTLVIITSEDHYGTTQKTITFRDEAQYTDHAHILYCGYLFSENDDLIDDGSGLVTLSAVSAIPLFLYSLSLTGVENASEWYEMNKELMTVAGNLFHLLKYHSTLLEIMDWRLPWLDGTKRSANEEFGEGALFSRAHSLISSRLMAMTATAQGEVWIQTDLNLRNSADRTAAITTLILTDDDITGTKRARRRHYGDQIRTLLDGGSSTGLLGSFTPFLSASQNIASAEGRPQLVNFSRIMLSSQTEADRMAGRIATVANNEYQEVNLELSGNYRAVFSPGDQQKVDLGDIFNATLAANIKASSDLEDVDIIVRSVSNKNSNGFTSVSIIADIMAAEGLTGVTLPIPTVPPDAVAPGSGSGSGSFDEPDPPKYPPVPEDQTVAGALVALDATSGVYFSLDSGSSWEQRNGGLSATSGMDLIWDPWWFTAFGNNSSNPEDVILWWVGTSYIRRSSDAGKTWNDFTQYLDDPDNVGSDAPAPTKDDLTYVQIRGDIHNFGTFYVLARWQNGASAWRSWVYKTTDNGYTWTSADIHAISDDRYLFRHESDDLSEYTSSFTASGGTVASSAAAAMNGTNFGLVSGVTGAASKGYGERLFTISGTQLTVEFYFDPNSLTMPSVNPINWNPPNADIMIFQMLVAAGGSTSLFLIEMQNNAGTYVIRGVVRDDGGVLRATTDPITLVDAPQKITVVLNKATTASSNDGSMVLKINDVTQDTKSGLDYFNNYTNLGMVRVGLIQVNEVGISGSCYHDEVSGIITAGTAKASQTYGMSLTTDQESGSDIYISSWKDGTIYVEKYSTGLIIQTTEILGTSTIAQVTGLTYFAAVVPSPHFTAADFGSTVWVFGRWDDGSVKHIAVTTNAAASWTNTGDGAWTTERVGAFFTASPTDWYALLNAGTAELQESVDTGASWANISTPPFSVEYEALSVHPDGRLQIGNRIAAAQMGAYLDTDWSVSSWINNTGSPSLPTGGGGIKAIIWIV